MVDILESVVDIDEIARELIFFEDKSELYFGDSLFIEYLCERLFTMNEKLIYNED